MIPLEKYKIKMKQADVRNIPPCYLRNAMDAVPSVVREILRSGAEACEGEGEEGKFRFEEGYVCVRGDATIEIHGLKAEARDRILSKLKHFDVEKVE